MPKNKTGGNKAKKGKNTTPIERSQPIKDIAKKAVEVLIQQINQRSATIEHIVLKTALVERESVK